MEEECVNDDSVRDGSIYGYTCSELYNTTTTGPAAEYYCGGYDTDDFVSAEMCCLCGGGSTNDVMEEEWDMEEECVNDDSVADSYGDTCSGYYTDESACGSYDTDDFVSAEMCCVCGGGSSYYSDESSDEPVWW